MKPFKALILKKYVFVHKKWYNTKFAVPFYPFNIGMLWGNSGTDLIAVPDLAN